MDRKHRLGFSWLAVVLCMALLVTGMPFAPAYAKSKKNKETYYTIKWKVNGEVIQKDKVKKGEKPEKPADPADYDDGKYTYVFSGWEPKVAKATKDVTYKAKFKKTARTVTVTWLDDEGKLIDFTKVKYGKLPTHDDPKKKATKKYAYTFEAWEPELVKATEDATYTATFKRKARQYKITWLDDKGNVIDETKVAYGKLPTHDDPVKKSSKYSYTFVAWEPALTEVTGDATYTAKFKKGEEKQPDTYTITWQDDEGNVIDTTEVAAGEKPTHDDPVKDPTEKYTYTFEGWEPKVVKAKAEATYTATFKQKTRKYKITWQDDEGNTVDETRVAYGKLPTHDALTLADSETHSYIFKGWTPDPVEVTGEATYMAVFEEIPKATEATEAPTEPETPVEPEAPAETETPTGPEAPVEVETPVEPEAPAETEAPVDTEPEQTVVYTVSWLDDAGNVIDTTTALAGEVPTHDAPEKAATEQYSYAFAGWSPEPAALSADAAYTATYTETLRSYAVSWLDDAGNVIDTTLVPYGEMPAHADPVKAATESATYTFAGWTPELAPVTGEAAYTAKFDETQIVTGETEPETVEDDKAVGNSVEVLFKYVKADGKEGDLIDYPQRYVEQDEAQQVYYKGVKPVQAETETAAYEWIGWTDDITQPLVAKYGKSIEGDPAPAEGELPLLPVVTKDTPAETVYYAVFKALPLHTINWNNDDGTPIGTTKVAEGQMPTHDDPAKEGFKFAGWEPALAPVTGDATYTAKFTATTEAFNVTWVIDGQADEVTSFAEGAQPTHVNPADKGEYKFAGWADAKNTLYLPEELPVVTAAATYTAQWKKEVALPDVNCHAYIKSGSDKDKAKTTCLPKEPADLKEADGTAAALDWSTATLDIYDPLKNGAKNDGTYTYTLLHHEKNAKNNILAVTCKLIVGPKKSETIGSDNKENKEYTYRWDSIVEKATDAKAIITAWTGTEKTLTIPSKIDGVTVGEIGDEAFKDKKDLTSVTIPAGVTAIGKSAFAGCAGLTSITVPAGVTAIEKSAFENCTGLTSLTLPDSLTSIGMDVTKGCDKLVNTTLTVGLKTTMGKDANNCYTIKHMVDENDKTVPPKMTQTVTLPTGFPTDIAIAAPGALTLTSDFEVLTGHSVSDVSLVTQALGKLKAEITWQDDAGTYLDTTFVEYGQVPGHADAEKAASGIVRYRFREWTPALAAVTSPATYSAAFDSLYPVTFVNEDGSIIEDTHWGVGEQPTCGITPTKAEDTTNTYTFDGWVDAADTSATPTVYANDKLPVVTAAEVTYKAHFAATLRKYTVTFVTEDGKTELEKTEYDAGATPKYSKTELPTKEADATNTYTFDGWVDAADTSATPTVYANDKLPAVTTDVTYKAHFAATLRKYTVTFVSEDGKTELEKTEYDAGTTPKYSKAAPTKAADATHYYLFDGWVDSNDTSSSPTVHANDKLPAVTADVTYKAHFNAGTPVALTVTYSGGTLTKEYDCNTYGAYSKDGHVVYVIPELKTIKSKFKLDLAKNSSWIEGHRNVDFKLTLAKQFSSADVGDKYQFEFRVALTGDDAAYYTVNQSTITVPAAITQREVVITPRAGLSKVYGTKDPSYPEGSWLSNDESSPLHQNLSGVPGYGVPVNTKDGKLSLTVTNAAYLLQEARNKNTKFFPNDGWLSRKEGEDVGKYDITIGNMDFGSNFKMTLKPEVFTITAKNIADANVTVKAIGNQQYTGKPIKLDATALVVQYGANTLVEDKDFTTEYTNNTEASTDTTKATVKLTGKGNYTGTRELTFIIIKTTTPTATPAPTKSSSYSGGSSSSSSGGYNYDGFDDDDESESGEESNTDPNMTPARDGILLLPEMDYGTVLFGADGKPRSFLFSEEEYIPEPVVDEEDEFEDFDDMEGGELDIGDDSAADDGAIGLDGADAEPTPLRRLTLKADSLKQLNANGEEEDVLLEGTDRKRYEELHLRLTNSTIQGLINNGVGEIVYELEQARLRLPLAALTAEIVLPPMDVEIDEDEGNLDGEGVMDEDFDVDEEIEIEDDAEEIEVDDTEGFEVEDGDVPVNAATEVQTLPVDGYDIVIEQADANGLSSREQALIGDNQTLMPAYRVRVNMIPAGAEQLPSGALDENNQSITVPETEPLPEDYTLPRVVLMLQPTDVFESAPTEAQVLYASPALAVKDAADDEVAAVEEAADDEEELEFDSTAGSTGNPFENFSFATNEDAATDTESEADADDATADAEATLDPLETGEATLTPAVFNEEDTPVFVEVEPFVDGTYTVIVPPTFDPTPYLASAPQGENGTDMEAGDDEELDFEDEPDGDEEIEL